MQNQGPGHPCHTGFTWHPYLRPMLGRLLFWLIVGYLLYRFIVNFLVPLLVAGNRIRKQVKQMKQQMNDAGHFTASQNKSAPGSQPPHTKNHDEGEYIDFEEIK